VNLVLVENVVADLFPGDIGCAPCRPSVPIGSAATAAGFDAALPRNTTSASDVRATTAASGIRVVAVGIAAGGSEQRTDGESPENLGMVLLAHNATTLLRARERTTSRFHEGVSV
jgi:hypothetical protein